MKRYSILVSVLTVLLTSCAAPANITYLQDIAADIPLRTREDGVIRFLPGDKISINVHSREPDLTSLFTLANQRSASTTGTAISSNAVSMSSGNNNTASIYLVDSQGNIDFPELGAVRVAGLSREELARTLKFRIISSSLCLDPIVTVEFANLKYSVLGEVSHSGEFAIDRDNITIIDAIARAGDLTINGVRGNVLVLRTENGVQTPYRLDLTKTSSVYSSPVFYIHQNDVIYVDPNDMRKRQTLATGSQTLTPAFWMSVASFLTTTGVVFLNIFKK